MSAVKVMLVEDDPDMGTLISHTLRFAGYQVVWVKDGIQALQAAKQSPPALIVLDFMFPAGGGAPFLKRVRMAPQTASVPIVVISGVPKELITSAVDPGMNAYYLPKPYDKNELLKLIAGMLSGAADPAYQLHRSAAAPGGSGAESARGSVLVVGANGAESALIRSTLQRSGFRVAEAGGAAQALIALGLEEGSPGPAPALPDLIVLDAEIDFRTGHRFNARLSREAATHSIPVVVVTGGVEMRAAFSDATNVAAYLNRPLDPQRLLRHAEEIVPSR